MRNRYENYEQIPGLVREYVLTVADRKVIEDIPLTDINSFLEGLDQFYSTRKEEHSEGWVE